MQRRPNVEHRDRLINRVSAVGQLSALVAMASTGVTAGVLAHDARAKDLAAARARSHVAPAPAPVQVRLVPRPVRTVLVRVPAPAAHRTTAVRRTVARTSVRSVPARISHPAPQPVARPVSQPAATTSTGS